MTAPLVTDIIIISPPGNDSFREDLSFTADVLFFYFNHRISEIRRPIGGQY